MLHIPEAVLKMFSRPRTIFTVLGNPDSMTVISRLLEMSEDHESDGVEYRVFASVPEAMAAIDPTAAVALQDSSLQGSKHFSPTLASRQNYKPLAGAQWGVMVSPRIKKTATGIGRCANQVYADFVRNFDRNLGLGNFPWGRPRKGEDSPSSVKLHDGMDDLLDRLNDGPDLKRSVASESYALELPADSKISWLRIPPQPFVVDRGGMLKTLSALSEFEEACTALVRQDRSIQELLLAGVDLPPDSPVRDCYIYPVTSRFSVRRPDLHYTDKGVFASENDEMPGGFPELFHLDNAYGVHEEEWRRAFEWLTSEGDLLFVVSSNWSSVYVPEMEWFAAQIRKLGFPARMLTTDRLHELDIRNDGVYDSVGRVGTIWRQFPIFETTGMLALLVQAAHQGIVRMVPEFGHWGNKAWFSIFRTHSDFFSEALGKENYDVLREVLPDSYLLRSEADFPFMMRTARNEYHFSGMDALRRLPAADRSNFVLKICGANNMAARSYGVLMGKSLSDTVWSTWIDERLALGQPFIMQTRLQTAVARIPVLNTQRNAGEMFSARVLMRPYVLNEDVVSISACAVPSYTERVHGMVDMALGPVVMQ